MSDVPDVLEGIRRQVRGRPGSLDRIHAAHAKRERNRRVAAGAVALAIAVAAIVVVAQFAGLRMNDVPASPVIDGGNVSRLAPAWSVQLPGTGTAPVVAADGVIYAGSDEGKLYALDARSGRTEWIGEIPVGIATAPVVAQGTVLVEAAGTLSAFDIGCASGGAICSPRWTTATGGVNLAPPTVSDGIAYLTVSPGGLSAFPLDCPDPCVPLWTAASTGAPIAHSPAVAEGIVWDSTGHTLAAYPSSCADPCRALADGITWGGAELSSAPAVAGSAVYVGATDGRVFGFATSCAGGGACRPTWMGRTGGGVDATPMVADGRVFVASTDGGLSAFPTSCASSSCRPLWHGSVDGAIDQEPAVSGGLVFVTSVDGSLTIFPESCARACAALAVVRVGSLPPTPSVWADRVVYVVNADGRITAYTVDGSKV